MVALLGLASIAGRAPQVGVELTRQLCAKKLPKQPEAQQKCRKVQTAAATRLLILIEAAPGTSLEFAIAKTCIERAKISHPSMIDWTQALTCYETRLAKSVPTEDP